VNVIAADPVKLPPRVAVHDVAVHIVEVSVVGVTAPAIPHPVQNACADCADARIKASTKYLNIFDTFCDFFQLKLNNWWCCY
jgi:hypothetical protein